MGSLEEKPKSRDPLVSLLLAGVAILCALTWWSNLESLRAGSSGLMRVWDTIFVFSLPATIVECARAAIFRSRFANYLGSQSEGKEESPEAKESPPDSSPPECPQCRSRHQFNGRRCENCGYEAASPV